MKTKVYIGILGALLIPGMSANAQWADAGNYRNNDAGIVINNYYDYDYDFYYSSRIKRFHSPYVTFSYYSPVFTDVFWYTYQPFTWGMTIYGGGRIGVGLSYNYPLYYNYLWDYPSWYYDSYYIDYYPVYYSWYPPLVVNVRIGNRWSDPWHDYHIRNHWYNDYRPVYNTYNYYYTTSGRSDGLNVSRRITPSTTSSTVNTNTVNTNTVSRREGGAVQTSGRSQDNTGGGEGRTGKPANNRIHQGDQGNNNSMNPGNTENVNRRVNSGNNPGVGNRSNNSNNNNGNNNNNNDNSKRQVDQGQSQSQGNVRPAITSRPQTGAREVSNAQQNQVNKSSSGRPSSGSGNVRTQSGNRTNVAPQTRQSAPSRNAVRPSSRQSGNASIVRSAPAKSKSSSSAKSESKSSSRKSDSSESSSSRRK